MGLEDYQLCAQLGAGPDGVAYRATGADAATTVVVLDLARARADAGRWARLVPRLRLAAGLEHPAAIRILELGLEHPAPYAVQEWVGETTLVTADKADLPANVPATGALIRAVAGALAVAHRLGIAHGRLGPDQVFLTKGGHVKLDFGGASVGFPQDRDRVSANQPSAEQREDTSLAELRAADLYGLGALISWLGAEREDSQLGKIARELMAEDATERPTALEVQARLLRAAADGRNRRLD